jgi:hypothetical protein
LSEDPIGLAGGINSYAFAGGDPVNGRDPSGLAYWCRGSGTVELTINSDGYVIAVKVVFEKWFCTKIFDAEDDDEMKGGGGGVDSRSCGGQIARIGNNVFLSVDLVFESTVSTQTQSFVRSSIAKFWQQKFGGYDVTVDLAHQGLPVPVFVQSLRASNIRGSTADGGGNIRLWINTAGSNAQRSLSQRVVAHEFGHLFNIPDGFGPRDGLMGSSANPGNKMYGSYVRHALASCRG